MEVPGLKRARLAVPMTQADLADLAHITRPTVIAAEKGRRVRISTVVKLAYALGVDPVDLLQHSGEQAQRAEDQTEF